MFASNRKCAAASTTPHGVQLASKPVVEQVWSMCGTRYIFKMIRRSSVRWLLLPRRHLPLRKSP